MPAVGYAAPSLHVEKSYREVGGHQSTFCCLKPPMCEQFISYCYRYYFHTVTTSNYLNSCTHGTLLPHVYHLHTVDLSLSQQAGKQQHILCSVSAVSNQDSWSANGRNNYSCRSHSEFNGYSIAYKECYLLYLLPSSSLLPSLLHSSLPFLPSLL